MTAPAWPAPAGRLLPTTTWILAALYAATGVLAMWLLSPRVPYADGWRHLARYLELSFPADVLTPDNGHHELLPNLVRVLDVRLFDAGQGFQVLVGIALALATLLVYWRGIRGQPDAARRAGGLLAIALGLFWLGNIRALGHGNESVHAYCVTLFLAIGLHALVRARGAAEGAVAAAACGLAASFSFGSGFACFAAFALVLLLRRSGPRAWTALAAGAVLSLLLLHFAGGTGGGARLAPLQQLPMLLAWLSGPSLYAAWPLLDPQLASALPLAAVGVPAQAVATEYEAAFGPAIAGPWPQQLVGLLGLAWMAWLAWRAWSTRSAAMLAGLGTAGFAVAVGMMIVLVRLDYFHAHPDQLLAPRYVVWSSLFWAGLLLAAVAGNTRRTRAPMATALVALLLLPSQVWMGMLGQRMGDVAAEAALAATVGVVEPGFDLGETPIGELAAALPVVRAAGVAVFAWPESAWLEREWPAGEPRLSAMEGVEVEPVDNLLGDEGRRLRFATEAPCGRLLLLDAGNRVAGLATRRRDGSWIGWMTGRGPLPAEVAACAPPLR